MLTQTTSKGKRLRIPMLAALLICATMLATCGIGASDELYVPSLIQNAQQYNGKDISVDGAYLSRSQGENACSSCFALGVSTLDSGLDAIPLGEIIWLDGFPHDNVKDQLHQPGDAIYGFVRVNGRFESGGNYGPDGKYKHRIQVAGVEPIERVQRTEVRIENRALPDGKPSLFDLADNGAQYNGQKVTTQGYYFWNGPVHVLAEGISTEEDGGSPQPIGKQIWMENFPPDVSGALNVGPNNSFVWGKVEVTGQFQAGGQYGNNGAYTTFLQVDSNGATALEGK